MASAKHTRPLTRSERGFLDKALLVAGTTTVLKNRRLSPEGAAHAAADYARALLAERRLILTRGI